jgi:putative heme-binding domain-containing protein
MKSKQYVLVVAAAVSLAGGVVAAQTPASGGAGQSTGAAATTAADTPYPGSNMTRAAILEKLTSDTPGTTPSVDEGRQEFETICSGCHTFGDVGNAIGPDLTTVGARFKKHDVLDSILYPSHTISDQYAVTLLEMTDGSIESGLVFREDDRYVYIRNADHLIRPLPVPVANIKDRATSDVSLMPEGLMGPLTLNQIDSLVTFLLTGR